MADCYGIVVVNNWDCVFDAAGLANALNGFERWSNDGGSWQVEPGQKRDFLWFTGRQYPSAIPQEEVMWTIERDGEILDIPVDDMTDDDWDNGLGPICGPAPLSELVARVLPFIHEGDLIIQSIGNEKYRYVTFSQTIIRRDGTAEYTWLGGNGEIERVTWCGAAEREAV